MAAPMTHLKVSSAWKEITNAHVKVGGVWKLVKNIYVKAGSAWNLAWQYFTVNLSGVNDGGTGPNHAYSLTSAPTSSTAGWRFFSDGSVNRTTLSGGYQNWAPTPDEWTDPDNAVDGSKHWMKFTQTGVTNPGPTPTLVNITADTWTRFDSASWFEIKYTRSGLGTTVCRFRIDIADDASGSNILATGYYATSSTVEPSS